MKELEKMYEAEKKKNEKNESNIKKKDEEISNISKVGIITIIYVGKALKKMMIFFLLITMNQSHFRWSL